MAVIPHLQIPFRLSPSGSVAVLEQDSLDEIGQCVGVLMKTRLGERVEVPDYGIPDQPFLTEAQIRTTSLISAVERWEPRAKAEISSSPDPSDDLRRSMQVVVKVSDETLETGTISALSPRALVLDSAGNVIWGQA